MSNLPINNRLTKADLLDHGWHSIYYSEHEKEVWAHQMIPGYWDLKAAKKITKALKEKLHG